MEKPQNVLLKLKYGDFIQKVFLFSFVFAIFAGCKGNNLPTQDKEGKTKLLFYTNAQNYINTINVYVEILLDGNYVGRLDSAFSSKISDPPCQNTGATLLVEVPIGKEIKYYAGVPKKFGTNSPYWVDRITPQKDSCYKIFLDIEKSLTTKG